VQNTTFVILPAYGFLWMKPQPMWLFWPLSGNKTFILQVPKKSTIVKHQNAKLSSSKALTPSLGQAFLRMENLNGCINLFFSLSPSTFLPTQQVFLALLQ
jgi:hypothetical protein